MPSSAQNGWFGELLLRVDPFTADLHVLNDVVVNAHGIGTQLSWIAGLTLAATLACTAALVVAGRLNLSTGSQR